MSKSKEYKKYEICLIFNIPSQRRPLFNGRFHNFLMKYCKSISMSAKRSEVVFGYDVIEYQKNVFQCIYVWEAVLNNNNQFWNLFLK